MTSDALTSLAELRNAVRQFVEERDWQQFHAPKNLAMALSIEAAELMEHFQWISAAESRALDSGKLANVGHEMADVLCYLLALANQLDIDLTSTFFQKMEMNRAKYPVSQFKGRFGRDDHKPVQTGK